MFKVNGYHRPNHPVMAEVPSVGCSILQGVSFLMREDKMVGEHVKSILSCITQISNPLACIWVIYCVFFMRGMGEE